MDVPQVLATLKLGVDVKIKKVASNGLPKTAVAQRRSIDKAAEMNIVRYKARVVRRWQDTPTELRSFIGRIYTSQKQQVSNTLRTRSQSAVLSTLI